MAYRKPAGYKYSGLTAGASRYKPNNNFLSGNMNYAPGAPNLYSITYQFTAAPADNSTLTIQDGPPNSPASPTKVFTFVWAGSPGAGIIPLVAGGGTAADAAIIAQNVLSGQLTNYTVVIVGDIITLTQKQKGVNPVITPSSSPSANMNALTGNSSTFGPVLPGRIGMGGCTLAGS